MFPPSSSLEHAQKITIVFVISLAFSLDLFRNPVYKLRVGPSTLFRSIIKPLTAVVALVALAAYATIMLSGPQGLRALTEKRQQVQALEEENADLVRDIEAKKLRIEKLKHDPSTQELEVRKRLRMQRQGDTEFVLPDQKTVSPSASPSANPS